MKILKSIFIVIFLASCNPSNKNTVETDSEQVIDDNGLFVQSLIEQFQSVQDSLSKGSTSEVKINYFSNEDDDSLKVSLFFDGERSYSLRYPTFDLNGNFIVYESVFFGTNRQPLSILTENIDGALKFCDLESGSFFTGFNFKNGELIEEKITQYVDSTYQCELIKHIDNLMHKFSVLGRYSIVRCINEMPNDYRVIEDSVKLFSSPETTSEYTLLVKGTDLKYIKADSKSVEVNGNNLYFIRVRSAIDSGWILSDYSKIMSLDEVD